MPLPAARSVQPAGPLAIGLLLTVVSMAAAVLAARITFGLDGWLWNLDTPKIHYPLAAFFHDALARGGLPIWVNELGLGFPLYAEGQVGAFYPPNWLIFQLEPLAAMDLSRLVHLTMTGLGTGLIALRLSGSRLGAVVAAVGIVLGGATVTKLEWWNLTAAFAWAPWVLLPLTGRRAPERWEVATAGVLWGIQALTGHPQTWMLTGLAAVILLLARRPWLPAVGRTVAFGVLGIGVGALQLVPTYLLLGLSDRADGLPPNELFGNAATPFDVLSVGFANAFLRTINGDWDYATNWYPDGHFPLLNAGIYLGLPLVALAGVGMATRRGRPWLAVAAVMLVIPVVAAFQLGLWTEIPILNGLRSPVRSYMFIALAAVVLAAIGLSRLRHGTPRFRWAFLAMGTAAMVYVVAVGLAEFWPAAFDQLTRWSWWAISDEAVVSVRERAVEALSTFWPFLLELGLALAIAVLLTRPLGSRLAPAAAALALLPLVLLMPPVNPAFGRDRFSFEDTPFVRMMAGQDAHRVLTVGAPAWYAGMPDQLAAAGVPDVSMFSSLNLEAVDDLADAMRAEGDDGPLRRVVGIDRVVVFGESCPSAVLGYDESLDASVCAVDGTLRPPYWIPEAAAARVNGSTPPRAELDAEAALATAVPLVAQGAGSWRTEVEVTADAAGWIFLDRAWWPGWVMTVDGLETSAAQALGGTLVPVPAGDHVVVSELALPEVKLGALAGLGALVGGALWVGWPRLRRGRAGAQPDSTSR